MEDKQSKDQVLLVDSVPSHFLGEKTCRRICRSCHLSVLSRSSIPQHCNYLAVQHVLFLKVESL